MKRHLMHLSLIGLFGLVAAVGLTACEDNWRSPRCTSYENFRSTCAPSCPELADCALLDTLESLSASELDLADFDACIACLDDEADTGTCRDCQLEPNGESCQALLADWLDLDCL